MPSLTKARRPGSGTRPGSAPLVSEHNMTFILRLIKEASDQVLKEQLPISEKRARQRKEARKSEAAFHLFTATAIKAEQARRRGRRGG